MTGCSRLFRGETSTNQTQELDSKGPDKSDKVRGGRQGETKWEEVHNSPSPPHLPLLHPYRTPLRRPHIGQLRTQRIGSHLSPILEPSLNHAHIGHPHPRPPHIGQPRHPTHLSLFPLSYALPWTNRTPSPPTPLCPPHGEKGHGGRLALEGRRRRARGDCGRVNEVCGEWSGDGLGADLACLACGCRKVGGCPGCGAFASACGACVLRGGVVAVGV